MRFVFLLLSLVVLLPSLIISQEIVTYHSGGVNQTGDAFVHVFMEIDLSTCESEELLVMETPLGERPLSLADIGIAPDGFLYGMDSFEGLYQIDLQEGEIVNTWPLPFGIQYGGMVIDAEGLIILSGQDGRMATFDVASEEFTDLGMLDDNFPVRLTLSGIAKYRDRLFGSLVSGHLVEIFLDEMRAEYIMESMNVEQSLFIYEEECDEPVFITGTNRGTLRLLDPDLDTFYNLCQFDIGSAIFTGITSFTEYQGFPDCRDTIDLNATEAGFDHFQLDECGIGRAFIAHDSAEVYGDFSMDSIRVFMVEEPEPGSGRLESEPHAGIAVDGEGTAELLAGGVVDFEEWESWLRSVEYVDSSPEPLPGLRRIAVVGYFNEGETTDTAWSEIEVLQPDFSAGADVEVEECPTGNEISLHDYLSGADPDGTWVPEVPGGVLELLPDNSGSYYYIVEHPDCGSDTAVVELFVWPGPDVGISGGGTICEGRTTTLSASGELDDVVSFLWSDGTTASSIEVSEAGSYWLRLVYGEDCIWTDTVEVVVEQTIHMEEELSLCPGEQTEWHGQQIESAGEYETTLPGTDEACDTLLVLTVTEAEYVPKEMEAFLCPGQELEIEGETIDAPGTYEFVLDAETGCDTLLTLEVYARDFEGMQEIISKCPGEVVWYMGEQIEDAGEYEFLLPAADGCDTVVHLLVETYSLPEVEVTGPDLLCEGQQIELRASPAEQLQEIRWSSGETTETIQVSEGGIYGFEALSLNDCEVSAEKEIGECPSRQIYIPNAFSPNGDGINDEWTVYPASDPVRMEVQIYDRWGSRVFESSTPDFDWDGTFRGEESPPGVYVFRLTVEFSDGHEEVMSGDFVLVR